MTGYKQRATEIERNLKRIWAEAFTSVEWCGGRLILDIYIQWEDNKQYRRSFKKDELEHLSIDGLIKDIRISRQILCMK